MIKPSGSLAPIARRTFRRVIGAALVSSMLCGVPQASAQPILDNFEMGKRTTWLARSEKFETVTFLRVNAADGSATPESTSKAPPLRIPADIARAVRFPALESRGVLLIRMAEHVSPRSILPIIANYNDENSHAAARYVAVAGNQTNGRPLQGNPIYATGEINNIILNEVVIRFVKGTDAQRIAETFQAFNAKIIRSGPNSVTGSYIVQFPGASGHKTREFSNRLDSLAHVQFAQPNFVIVDPQYLQDAGLTSGSQCPSRCPDAVPVVSSGDKYFVKQWHLENTGVSGKKFADTNAQRAWQKTPGNSDIVIAVLDDLVEREHPDLADKIHQPWDAFCEDGSEASLTLTETDIHGTAVAGLAAAVTGNLKGVAGMAPKVKIMPIRTHGDSPCRIIDGVPVGNHAAIAAAIIYAVTSGADVLSMSFVLGTAAHWSNGIPIIEDTLGLDEVKGRVLVFAAGYRTGPTGIEADYPASRTDSYENIVPVAATDSFDALKIKTNLTDACDWSSNFGNDTVAAPGVDLYTTDRSGSVGYCDAGDDSSYAKFSGVSAATPLVAGVAALMLSNDPSLTPLQIRTQLQQSAEHPHPSRRPLDAVDAMNPSGWGKGWGRIDACRALGGGDSCTRQTRPKAPRLIDLQ